jgi:hypothetical protein
MASVKEPENWAAIPASQCQYAPLQDTSFSPLFTIKTTITLAIKTRLIWEKIRDLRDQNKLKRRRDIIFQYSYATLALMLNRKSPTAFAD